MEPFRGSNLLEYEVEMFTDLIREDSLVLAAKGINLDEVLLNLFKTYCDPGNLVLVLNCSDFEEKYFIERLEESQHVHSVTFACNVNQRRDLYLSGGLHFVTTRILSVDMLQNRLPIDKITGLILLKAHSILQRANEAWILRMYRNKNKTGFIKAFSNSAQSLSRDLDRALRALYLKYVNVWPRFHTLISPVLKKYEANVSEFKLPLSDKLEKMQMSLLELMNLTVAEVKRANPALETSEVTVENCLSKRFEKSVRYLGVWHRLSSRTTQLIADLKTLSYVMSLLLDEDCVTFYAALKKYRSMEYVQTATWPILRPAETLFKYAKARVMDEEGELNPEPCLKWKTLNDLLTVEIPHKINEDVKEESPNRSEEETVLILCKDSKTCRQLTEVIVSGPQRFLFTKACEADLRWTSLGKNYRFDAEKHKKEAQKATEEECDKSSVRLTQNLDESFVVCDETDEETGAKRKKNEDGDEGIGRKKPNVVIQSFKHLHSDLSLTKTLLELRPKFVVMYHFDLAAIRQIEIYSARSGLGKLVNVFFLEYDKSVDEQRYLTTVRRERVAFEDVIERKSRMVITRNQDGKEESDDDDQATSQSAQAQNTRKGGNFETADGTKRKKGVVIVDMREFRSELPSLVHKLGLDVVPQTLKVGDYILTPDICVERKTVSDLIGSLNNGRLHEQCKQMFRYYKRPMLMIEFDANRPMSFEVYKDSRSDRDKYDVKMKLILLTIHFPKLMIVYCHGAVEAAKYFKEFKEGKPEPSDKQLEGEDLKLLQSKYNPVAYDFVEKLPGITSKNIDAFMRNAGNMRKVAAMDRKQLEAILGETEAAKNVFEAIHSVKCDDLEQKEQKGGKQKRAAKFKYVKGKKSKRSEEGEGEESSEKKENR